jgi:hypothetical protein
MPRGENAARVLDELKRAYVAVREYGVRLPAKVNARIYRSTYEFTQGSGGAAYNLAVWSRGVVHLQPARVLLRSGGFARSLRHELTHAGLAETAGSTLPRWLNEGLAMTAAGELQPETVRFRTLAALEDTIARSRAYATVRGAYGTAARLVRALVERYGRGRVISLAAGAAAGRHFESEFRGLTGLTAAEWGADALRR